MKTNNFAIACTALVAFIFLGCPTPMTTTTQPIPTTPPLITDYTATGVGTLKAVQGGSFNNGTATMTVGSFRISQYEVTRAQFLSVMGTDSSDTSWYSSAGMDAPVTDANWYHAITFCNKLSLTEGLTPVYSVSGISDWRSLSFASIPTTSNAAWNAATANWSANGYRLPTEAEWEFAARGGKRSNNYTYAGSNSIETVAVFGYGSSLPGATTTNGTTRVGSKAANELGLYDMSGNVWEWCWDWHGSYPAAQTDYRGAASGTYRIARGGDWASPLPLEVCTTSYRSGHLPHMQFFSVGFRVVRP